VRTVIYLSDQEVRILVGSVRGKKLKIEHEYYALAPAGCICGGKVLDELAFTDFLGRLRIKNNISMKDVTLVLSNAAALTRRLDLPVMPARKVMAYLPRAFSDVERAKDPVYAYTVLSRGQGRQIILANMAERAFLEDHIRLAAKMGVRLTSIVMSLTADITILKQLPHLREGAVVVQTLEGTNIKNLLLVDGRYYYFNRNRIRSEKGSPGFGVECARAVNKLQQFLRSQQVEAEIGSVFLGGEYDKEMFEIVQESMIQMNDELDVQILTEGADNPVFCSLEPEGRQFKRFFPLMGALLVPPGRGNLLFQMKYSSGDMVKKRTLRNHLAPLFLTLAVCTGISLFQFFQWFVTMAQIDTQYDVLSDPEKIQKVAEYDRIQTKNETLKRQIQLAEITWNNLQSYPAMSTQVKQVVADCIAEKGTAMITDYHALDGVITIDVRVSEAVFAHQFIMRLEEHPETFEELEYSGFTFDDRDGNWSATVTCYLSRPGIWEHARQMAAGSEHGTDSGENAGNIKVEVRP